MRLASENNWRVECVGAGTQAIGNRRTRADIVLSSRKLTGVVEYDSADLVIGAQAGMPMRELQHKTARNAQFLALDPPVHDRSTLGGVIAAARSGPLRFAYGTPRDHVLGLQMVTGDGRVLNIGGRVVKNVAGYDLVRLMVGSAGTLGLITSAYLRLRPMPAVDQTVVITGTEPQLLLDVASFIVDENLEAVAVELVSPGLIAPSWGLLIRLCGNAEAVADAQARLQGRSTQAQLQMKKAALADWEKLEQSEISATTVVRLADVPSRIATTLQAAEKLAAKAGTDPVIAAHAGDGIVRVLLRDSDVENTAFAIGEARSLLVGSGGTVIAHSHNGDVMRRADAYGATGPTLQFMSKLKQLFDPASILAPGRFVI
jgi:glycolate oxidase FAD binding subunit